MNIAGRHKSVASNDRKVREAINKLVGMGRRITLSKVRHVAHSKLPGSIRVRSAQLGEHRGGQRIVIYGNDVLVEAVVYA